MPKKCRNFDKILYSQLIVDLITSIVCNALVLMSEEDFFYIHLLRFIAHSINKKTHKYAISMQILTITNIYERYFYIESAKVAQESAREKEKERRLIKRERGVVKGIKKIFLFSATTIIFFLLFSVLYPLKSNYLFIY